jgi:uncharacterized protein YggU (UPF0235/DUF167 family)
MYIKVRARTGAKKEEFTAVSDDHFTVAVKEKPQQNLANRRIIALVAAHFGVSPKAVRIISGHHTPSKMLSVEDK